MAENDESLRLRCCQPQMLGPDARVKCRRLLQPTVDRTIRIEPTDRQTASSQEQHPCRIRVQHQGLRTQMPQPLGAAFQRRQLQIEQQLLQGACALWPLKHQLMTGAVLAVQHQLLQA